MVPADAHKLRILQTRNVKSFWNRGVRAENLMKAYVGPRANTSHSLERRSSLSLAVQLLAMESACVGGFDCPSKPTSFNTSISLNHVEHDSPSPVQHKVLWQSIAGDSSKLWLNTYFDSEHSGLMNG